jgi:RNA polymerase sigma factor (sigma-70 family)
MGPATPLPPDSATAPDSVRIDGLAGPATFTLASDANTGAATAGADPNVLTATAAAQPPLDLVLLGAAPEVERPQPAPVENGALPAPRDGGQTILSAARIDVQRLPSDVSDGALLQRFVVHREQAAFTALVERHERLVSGVCQRVLGNTHAAEDALQATFMVLARKASMLDRDRPLASWLYKVAYHLALRFSAIAARQRRHETHAASTRPSKTGSEGAAEIEKRETHRALNEELQRLPEKYRAPLVLCYFDGRTHDEAARAIGLPRGSISKRIGEGLARLRERLIDRGVTL